ncbi:hypothetical protein BT96DRAFT_480277, partial [Gymnopus androsaceus JB14]
MDDKLLGLLANTEVTGVYFPIQLCKNCLTKTSPSTYSYCYYCIVYTYPVSMIIYVSYLRLYIVIVYTSSLVISNTHTS